MTKKTDIDTRTRPDVVRAEPFGRGVAEWFDRWPEFFGGRWPEFRDMPFVGENFLMEQFTDDDGTMVLRAELPGLGDDDDVDVTVDDGRLTISGRREERTEQKEKGSFRSEFRYGSFERTVRLPAGADTDAIVATYDDGILEVRVPVDEAHPSATSIPIKNRG